jgi:hypothetical protein
VGGDGDDEAMRRWNDETMRRWKDGMGDGLGWFGTGG